MQPELWGNFFRSACGAARSQQKFAGQRPTRSLVPTKLLKSSYRIAVEDFGSHLLPTAMGDIVTKVIERQKSSPARTAATAASKSDMAAYIAEISGGLAQMAHRSNLIVASRLLEMVRQDLAPLQDAEDIPLAPDLDK